MHRSAFHTSLKNSSKTGRPRSLIILGSTGSIGTSTLEVISREPARWRVVGLSTHSNLELLKKQIELFKPAAVCISSPEKVSDAALRAIRKKGIKLFLGPEGLVELVSLEAELLVNALVGSSGLLPTLEGIRSGKTICLANKESLVVAGELITDAARKKGVEIIPVDSEHSAIMQCLAASRGGSIRRIILTASGGPFRSMSGEQLKNVSVEKALCHPRWKMGKKITVDSATLMNKGFEVIEAMWLFNTDISRIEVLVHPESTIHSLVEFEDGSMLAQLASCDMRLPISLALEYPKRSSSLFAKPLDLVSIGTLHFEKPDLTLFPCLDLAYKAARKGGSFPAALNAANEIAVERFLAGKLAFPDIPKVIEKTMFQKGSSEDRTLENFLRVDREARICAERIADSLFDNSHLAPDTVSVKQKYSSFRKNGEKNAEKSKQKKK